MKTKLCYLICTVQFLSINAMDTADKKSPYPLYQCNFCPQLFKRFSLLIEHLSTHTMETSYACKHKGCSFVAPSTDDFIHHMLFAHITDSSYSCATERNEPNFHVESIAPVIRTARRYSRHQSHRCPFRGCTIATSSMMTLHDHVLVHTGEKRFVCHFPGCKYATIQKHNYLDHLKRHTGERPYKCTYPGCSYAAIQKRKLERHIERTGHVTSEIQVAAEIIAASHQSQKTGEITEPTAALIMLAAEGLMNLAGNS